MIVTTPKVACRCSPSASGSLTGSAVKKAAVKPSWILKSGMSVLCMPLALASLACRSLAVSTPLPPEPPSGTLCAPSTNSRSITPTTSLPLVLRHRLRELSPHEMSASGTTKPFHGWWLDRPFMTSKKWQTLSSSELRPPQMSTNDQEMPSVGLGSGSLTIAHDFSCASIESRSPSFGTIRSCSWKKRCSTSGYREASVTLLTMRVCASMARMDACEEPAEDGWDAWDRDGWDRDAWDRDAWDRDAWDRHAWDGDI